MPQRGQVPPNAVWDERAESHDGDVNDALHRQPRNQHNSSPGPPYALASPYMMMYAMPVSGEMALHADLGGGQANERQRSVLCYDDL